MADTIRDESILKTVKAINERLSVYERQGLTDSYNYRRIVERIKLEELPTTFSKEGELRISRKKTDLSSINFSSLQRVERLPSLREERKKLKDKGIKDTLQQNQRIQDYGNLEEWINSNLDMLYDDALAGMDEAKAFNDALSAGLRDDRYSDIFEMIRKYEEAKERRDAIYAESDWMKSFTPEDRDD